MSAALQLYTVRQQLAEDFAGTLRRIQEIGYRAVETYPFPSHITAERAGEVLKELQLEVVAMHCDLPGREGWPAVRDAARHLGCNRMIWHGWPRPLEFDSREGVEKLVERYNEVNAAARDHGLRFGLHNHWWEVEPQGEYCPLRIFNEELDPSVFLEVDVYWAQTAGCEPAALVREFHERTEFLHLKDGPAVHGKPMTALGEGRVDISRILGALKRPVQWVVELDECATDIFEASARSYQYLMARAGG